MSMTTRRSGLAAALLVLSLAAHAGEDDIAVAAEPSESQQLQDVQAAPVAEEAQLAPAEADAQQAAPMPAPAAPDAVTPVAELASAVAVEAQADRDTEANDKPASPVPNKRDPFESFNRGVFSFNEGLDAHLLKPVAEGYKKVVPELVRTGVENVLGNLGDVWSTVNNLLQGKIEGTARMTMRVLSNSIIGMGGIFDPATDMGLERLSEDFGQTLGRWGMPPGPYLVLPLLGPSTVRDAAATPANVYFGPTYFIDDSNVSLGVGVLNVISTRASLLDAGQMLDSIALDKYSFLRDAYLARRRNQVYDGNPPDEPDDSDADGAPAPAKP
ncbi:MAG TPA: VacJ family lipoprotein [Ideonella sp.]|uniref:MlaA family lipoprotein n=1 Tax=Ideonella sp. TaxID=1929293 RepID=UPI002BC7DE8D|nr:VacJ family lipoprotein [Ideonella sp.]HSI49290.1 VacJ family lipoprotein [Ideonella sp.]